MQDSRSYTHTRCRTDTTVEGPEFRAMSDPMAGMRSTYCVKCEDQFPVTEFAWSDTNELISNYYARHRKAASASDLWWCGNGGLAVLAGLGSVAGIILGIILGVTTTWLIGLVTGILLAITGAILGLVARETLFSRRIVKRVCGVNDTRMLR
ncbi:hypothetical protein Q31b_58290 [Novipirellula aureliae]|uniref:Uncharacterized protein n=1 Tax=Novipirellula aureliae TaxID=2527966 RepID=A0A5C6DA64_9BACT|nr:hypothetical protein [Novipirellula aureliae]TWU32671.1 hypothetical protein Q31b_58290 [Novipirellula aureliae]